MVKRGHRSYGPQASEGEAQHGPFLLMTGERRGIKSRARDSDPRTADMQRVIRHSEWGPVAPTVMGLSLVRADAGQRN
jgi:hypothetical protein